MSYEILKRHREIWQKKKVLRDIYHDWYRLIIENMANNKPALEIGSGGGNFKEFFPDVISYDYTFCEWIDLSSASKSRRERGNKHELVPN